MDILISAGEASGENYGAQLISEMNALCPGLRFFGLGGDRMQAAGCDLTVHAKDVAVVGLAEVVSHLPKIYGEFRRLLREADRRKPAAAVLIDFPDFNFRLARQLHRRGIPVFYYVSPQLWAWRQGRIRLVQRYVRKMFVIFPFEEAFYRDRGVHVEFVGHPLADLQPPERSREAFAGNHGLDPARHWIALLPGSRRKEIVMNLPEMLRAARVLGPDQQYLMPVASTIDNQWLASLVSQSGVSNIVFTHDSLSTLHHARAAVVASGTATMEATLMNVPFVMVYRVADLTWRLGRRFVSVPFFAMPNLIAGREVIPELVQHELTAENIVRWMRCLLPEGSQRAEMLAGLEEIRSRLRGSERLASPSGRVAATILAEVGLTIAK